MQDDSRLYKLLTEGWLYDAFQDLIGRRSAIRWMADNVWKCRGNESVLDIGCGTGRLLEYLPSGVQYTGFDISEKYIESAQRRYGARAQFVVGTAREFLEGGRDRLSIADLVLCSGVLHHLEDDEALDVLKLAKQQMNPGGRLVCMEPVYLAKQSRLSRFIISRDRGKNVRTERAWKELAGTVFSSFTTSVLTGLIRIPYVHIVIECRNA